MYIPEKVQAIWEALNAAGFPTYLVGGAVRDFLLGLNPSDFDLATKATPEEIVHVLLEKNYSRSPGRKFPEQKINYVGSSFGVILVGDIEIATFRGERYFGNGNDKDVSINYVSTIEEDLSRRDFTINAMALDIEGNLIDPFNGLHDLKSKVLQFVGDPNERINEDYNRILRACRFAANFELKFHTMTYNVLRSHFESVKKIKPERIQKEIMKAMKMKKPSRFFSHLAGLGFLEILFPELVDCMYQEGGKHHAEGVYEHCMIAGDSISPKFPLLRLAGFLHDIGKPKSFDGEKFIGHEIEGREIVEKRLKDLKFSNKEIKNIAGLIRCHMYLLKDMSHKAFRRLSKKLNDNDLQWRDLVRLRIADSKANLAAKNESISTIRAIINTFTQDEPEMPMSVKSLSVSGGQLIKELSLTPGPIVSKIQNSLFEFFIETGNNNEDCLLLESIKVLRGIEDKS